MLSSNPPSPSNSSEDFICQDSEPERQQYWATLNHKLVPPNPSQSQSRSCQSDLKSPLRAPLHQNINLGSGTGSRNLPISICSSDKSSSNHPSPITLIPTDPAPSVLSNDDRSPSDPSPSGHPPTYLHLDRSSLSDLHSQSERSDNDLAHHSDQAHRSVLSRFRYQSSSSASSRRSSAANKKICLPSPQPNSRARPTSAQPRPSTSSSACSAAAAPLEIGYRTLMQLKSCPACGNGWTTYKAPKSKLSHIEKCAQKQFIDPADVLQRVDTVLERQEQASEGGRSLLDRHLLKKNVEISVVAVTGADGEGSEAERRAVQLELLRRRKAGSDQLSPQPPRPAVLALQSAPKPAPSSRPSDPPLASPPDKPDLRSSLLKAAQLRTAARNAQVSAAGERSYSLWDLATGDNDFDYDRSSAPLSPTKPDRRSSQDEPWPARAPDGINLAHSEADCDRLSVTLEHAESVKPAMPRYERWTRQQLRNESERLGYDDDSEASTGALVGRARRGWLDKMGRPIGLGSGNDATESTRSQSPVRLEAGSASQSPLGKDDDEPQVTQGLEEEDHWETQGDWMGAENDDQPGSRESVEDEEDFWEAQMGWGAGEDEDVHWAARILGGSPQPAPGGEASARTSVRPDYASFSKAELELEYAKLHSSLVEPDGSQPALPDLPKTKVTILKRVIKLWNTLNDQLDEDRGGKKAKKTKVVKQKLTMKELDEIMMKICVDEPRFHLRILRYEPIKLSVFEDKLKEVLMKKFESSLAAVTDHQVDQQAVVVVQQTVTSEVLVRWLDWQAISYFKLDPTVSRKRY